METKGQVKHLLTTEQDTCGTGQAHSSPQGPASWQELQHSQAVCPACRARLSSHKTCMPFQAAVGSCITKMPVEHCRHSSISCYACLN